jgi:hypothetical protein
MCRDGESIEGEDYFESPRKCPGSGDLAADVRYKKNPPHVSLILPSHFERQLFPVQPLSCSAVPSIRTKKSFQKFP